MIHSLRRAALGAGLIVAAALAGCSSSGSSPQGGTSSPQGGTSPTGGAAPNAATTNAIKKAYQVFFDSRESTAHAVAALQHGEKFRSSIVSEGKSNYGKQRTTATVSTLQSQSPNVARVTFTVKVGGQALLPNSPGFAVREGGKWKVAAQTYCALLKIEGTAPPQCKDKSLTALPG